MLQSQLSLMAKFLQLQQVTRVATLSGHCSVLTVFINNEHRVE